MGTTSETYPAQQIDWSPALGSGGDVAEPDVQRLAETFAVTPDAVRLAVARVGTGFRDLQRELGGRR